MNLDIPSTGKTIQFHLENKTTKSTKIVVASNFYMACKRADWHVADVELTSIHFTDGAIIDTVGTSDSIKAKILEHQSINKYN